MKFLFRTALLGVLFSVAFGASAQWTWLDNDGRKVFSDRPPPADVAEKNILKRPSATAANPATVGNAANPAQPRPAALNAVGTEKELAAKLKEADDAEAARKKAEEERMSRVKADNCNRARQAKSTYDAGTPLSRINAKGERELVSNEARLAETQRLDTIMASDCN